MFHELKALLKLAWPLLIAQVTQTLMGVADTIMAGRFSYTDMAAVAIGHSITFPLLIFIQGITLALSPIISRYQGAGETKPVANALHQSIWLALLMSMFVLLLVPFLPFIFSLLDMEADVKQICIEYASFVLLAAPGFAVYQSLRNCCEGLSATRPTMIIMLVGLMINIPANYILINGLWGLPQLGGAGCGLATMIVFYLMALMTYFYATRAQLMRPYKLFIKVHKPNLTHIKQQFKMGIPISLTLVFEVTLFALAALLLAPLGAKVVAAHQIALNFSSLMFMLPMSLGIATAIRVGYQIGNKQNEKAKMAVNCALSVSMAIACTTATLTILANYQIASLYTDNTEVISMAASLLFFAALFQFSDGIQVVSANSLRGYKDTKAMFIISFICYWLIGLPVGVSLSLTDLLVPAMGAKGFWIGFITALSCAAVLMFWRLRIIQQRIRLNLLDAS